MSKVIIIAEAGVNHNGSLETAKQLIDAAADAGVDYVKFQTFKAENLVSKNAIKADYQILNTSIENETQFQMLKNLELSEEYHFELIEYCKQKKIHFFSTAFDLESIDFLETLQFDLYKIPSGEITNYPYLKKIGSLNKKLIISTGMATIKEINEAIKILVDNGSQKQNITVLHCNTEYPTPFEDVNLHAMLHIKKELNVNIGYSDHTLGVEVPIAAVALGATIIEKHFTLNKMMDGPDHKASLEPNELKNMVTAIRNIEQAISGSGLKEISKSEKKNISIARKSIVAKYEIQIGESFNEINLTTKRPGDGISPMEWDNVLGKISTKHFLPDEKISLN